MYIKLEGYKIPRCVAWEDECYSRDLTLMPIESAGICYGVLLMGINPKRKLDDDYKSFLKLVTRQTISVISNAM